MQRCFPLAIALLLATVLLADGCSVLPRGGRPGMPRDSIVVFAFNENYYAARIHAIYDGGQRLSMGTVAGNGGRARIALPWEPRAVEFSVFLVTAGTTYLSSSFELAAGDSIELRVPLNISTSGLFRRVRE